MILIDLPMPDSCYECPIMMRCDDCEGYNNGCPLDGNIDCGYVVRRGEVVTKDRSNDTLWFRHPKCPLEEVVRCEDCRWWDTDGYGVEFDDEGFGWCDHIERTTDKDWFCADGEKWDESNT